MTEPITLLAKWRLAQAIAADPNTPPSALRVALRLLDHLNGKTGRCDPAHATIGAALGIGRRTVVDAIHALERAGWLRVERGGGDPNAPNGYSTNSYQFAVERLGEVPEAGRDDDPPRAETCTPGGAEVRTSPRAGIRTPPVVISAPPRGAEIRTQNYEQVYREEKPGTGNTYPPSPSPRSSRDRATGLPDELRADFSLFWSIYPRRERVGAAEAAFAQAVANGADPADLIHGVRAYARSVKGSEPKYVAGAARWLAERRWTDEPPAPSTGPDPITLDGDGNIVAVPPTAQAAPRRRMTPAEEILSAFTPDALEEMDANWRARRNGH